MVQHLTDLTETASQTAGPYVHIGCTPNFAGIEGIYKEDLGRQPYPEDAPGERITITGQVLDGLGVPLRDVMLESWQAGADGTFGPGAQGFARLAADQETGIWTLNTIKPGRVGNQSPHIALWIVARGINIGLQTRLYFEGDDHSDDPVLNRIEHRDRVRTLMARPEGQATWRFDIRLQGDGETVFLDI
ncbi:protocatechuate 3,4-dioxygenase subunit alpha [Thalassococcus sp. S3]|uniref:protocatechuate 3,4-dioxygenase subunit alpha n=1 Tax=Thalassococcus sp. S3 TaxID=2017482 RepID=UPI0010245027|nr:protocatechuate 3,4-dioxygenase subunit alpha [Thalassococcus sp. S3]QBF30713.1 protocatechuate 3,4-dioxygenase subunit alpha [Thalassococcus sp. S3]